jgi:hypothetical protein
MLIVTILSIIAGLAAWWAERRRQDRDHHRRILDQLHGEPEDNGR